MRMMRHVHIQYSKEEDGGVYENKLYSGRLKEGMLDIRLRPVTITTEVTHACSSLY